MTLTSNILYYIIFYLRFSNCNPRFQNPIRNKHSNYIKYNWTYIFNIFEKWSALYDIWKKSNLILNRYIKFKLVVCDIRITLYSITVCENNLFFNPSWTHIGYLPVGPFCRKRLLFQLLFRDVFIPWHFRYLHWVFPYTFNRVPCLKLDETSWFNLRRQRLYIYT